MAIVFKKTLRLNPIKPTEEGKYFPQIVNVGKRVTEETIIYEMKERSSLSKGDIESVISNFIEAMRSALFSGHTVSIRHFGSFSLSAKADGTATEDDCTASKIKSVNINFRPAPYIRPSLTATRGGEKLEFVDLVSYLKGLSMNGLSISMNGSGNGSGSGNGEEEEEYIDPNA